jgi:hypothetical protein
MRKVVDSNYLQSDKLHKYLSNPKNKVILTDQVSCEAIGSDLCRSFEILSQYPKQVVVLNRTQNILSMSLKSKGLLKRIVCLNDTKNFRRLSNKISNGKLRDENFNFQVAQMKNEATEELKQIRNGAEKMSESIIRYFSSVTKQEARILRSGPPYNSDALSIIIKNIEEMTISMFSKKVNFTRSRNYIEFYNSYLFRSGVCGYFLFQDWFLAGGLKDVKAKTMMNDLLDAQIAAYATYFDGLLSHDKKIQRVYEISNYFIHEIKNA